MTTINHWGKWIDSDTPTTGVLSTNDIAWEWVNDKICLTCEEIIHNIESDASMTEEEKEEEIQFMECDSSHTYLLGDWVKDDKDLYMPDEQNGEFSAIENESTVQVVWSKFTTKQCKLCSPCYPGQLDVDYDYENGEFIAYTLPDYLLRKDND